MKFGLRKQDSQWNTRKTTTRSNIKNLCLWLKRNYFGYTERMQHMMEIKVLHILSGNNIYFGIPLFIERSKRIELLYLLR